MADKNPQYSMSDLTALARSPDGQALFALLQKSNGPQLRRAMTLAASGDMAAAGAILAPLLSDPGVKAMIDRLGDQ